MLKGYIEMDKNELLSTTAHLLVRSGFNQKDAEKMVLAEFERDEKTLEMEPQKLMLLCLEHVNKTTYLNKDSSFPGVMTYEKSELADRKQKTIRSKKNEV